MLPCTALRLAAPNGVQSERKINPAEDQTKHPSHSEGDPVRRWSAGRPLTARDWFEYSRLLIRQLFACASAFSRSVAEGLSKASRTLVEALSKDCRTSLEQQSNNCRRNIEESCVCTHAMAPARSGLGLALGVVVLLLACHVKHGIAQETFSLEGKVISAASGAAIEGAAIRISNTDNLVFTGKGGTFEISSTQADGLLLVSYRGYETQKVPIHTGRLKSNKVRMVKDLTRVTPLVVGDSVTDYLWDIPLTVVNHPKGRSTITLREYQNKLLVLDFWATWCKPCIKTVDKWDVIQKQIPQSLAVLTVHMDLAERALPFIEKRGWSLPALVGDNYNIVNRHFFDRYQVGGIVMIYKGVVYAIPSDKGYDTDKLKRLLNGEQVEYHSDSRFIHTVQSSFKEGGSR